LRASRPVTRAGVAVLGLILGLMLPVVAYAWGYAESNWRYYTVAGREYRSMSYITVNDAPYPTFARSLAHTTDYQAVPAGYMGACARLYEDSGYLVASTSWVYNSQPHHRVLSDAAAVFPTYGMSYYSQGITAAFDGYWSYVQYYTYRSPSLTYPSP
jgi:hypothetical protein